jgi:hypothetical protein
VEEIQYQLWKSLGIAVVVQAIKDMQSETYAQNAESFVRSDEFIALADVLLEDLVGMPSSKSIQQRILAGGVKISRFAYH